MLGAQRILGTEDSIAPADDAAGERLSTALARLATLRRQVYADWSEGPDTLVAWANREAPGSALALDCWRRSPAPEIHEAPEVTPFDGLRGRFSSAEAEEIVAHAHAADRAAAIARAIEIVCADADEIQTHSGAGAFALPWPPQTERTIPQAEARPLEDITAEPVLAVGAVPALFDLLAVTPPARVDEIVVHPFDAESLLDDAIADAFSALLCAHDPLESLWASDAPTLEDSPAATLAASEAALWNLPRHVPCLENFLATPNHETAVKLTRALRLRANALQARAFAEGVDFGFLNSDADAAAFWFMADALSDATAASTGGAEMETSLPDWQMTDDGLIVVNAPGSAPPRTPAPLITEAELDALFAHVDEARAHILDDLNEDDGFAEPYWSDVDAYLAAESDRLDERYFSRDEGALADEDRADMLDIEVRDTPPAPAFATHFWMPEDPTDLALVGDGQDLFIVGGEQAAVFLVEDGASHVMRTGKPARMDEAVLSISHDPWSHIDGMRWTRLATLHGFDEVRVMQTSDAARQLVVAGSYVALGLKEGRIRLVADGADGEVDRPVTRVGDMDLMMELAAA
jgi:hypothetical protein